MKTNKLFLMLAASIILTNFNHAEASFLFTPVVDVNASSFQGPRPPRIRIGKGASRYRKHPRKERKARLRTRQEYKKNNRIAFAADTSRISSTLNHSTQHIKATRKTKKNLKTTKKTVKP